MEVVYKIVIIAIVLTSTSVNKSGCSDNLDVHARADTDVTNDVFDSVLHGSSSEAPAQTSKIFTALSSTSASTNGMTSPATTRTTRTTTTIKTTSSSLASVPSTVSSIHSTTMTLQLSTKTTPNLPDETSQTANVTMTFSSAPLSTSTSSPLTSSVTQKSSESSFAASLPTTLTPVSSVSVTSDIVVSTEDLSTSSSHTVINQDTQSNSAHGNTVGIVVGVIGSVVAVVLVVVAVFYFKRRQKRKSVVENVKVNYESEKFEDITDTDYDVITLTNSHYEKLQRTETIEDQYTMIVRGRGDGQAAEEYPVGSIESSSSYVLPNGFGVSPSVPAQDNGATSRYENTMFSLDLKDDCIPIKDDDDYIKCSEGDFKDVHVT